MNVIKTFEQRMNDVFSMSSQGFSAPISLRKLAKRTLREMESETYVVGGVNTAPALYTVLVAAADDTAMHAYYPQITTDLADCVEAEAARKGYVFVGSPLARFMVDPSLRSGKFAVFAENVDARTLEHIRREEEEFLSGASTLGGAASANLIEIPSAEISLGGKHQVGRHHASEAVVAAVEPVEAIPSATPLTELETLEPIAEPAHHAQTAPASEPQQAHSSEDQAEEFPMSRVPQLSSEHQREIPIANPVAIPVTNASFADDSMGLGVIPADYLDGAYTNLQTPADPIQPLGGAGAIPVPVTQRRTPAQPSPASVPTPTPVPAPTPIACTLVNHQTGESFNVADTQVVLGRERAQGSIVLRDPNVSRRHARISYDGRGWRIQDLQSTNGTLVNDIKINECALHDGDLITIGLVNLEFRES